MDTETEFRGVIDLNVNGVEHRALLSTLTKHEHSLLAEMFTGQHPVYKDKDGRYFLEANGSTFHAILHYLRYDEFPFLAVQQYSSGLFGGGFGGGARPGGISFGCSFSDADLRAIHADAVNLGLSSLVQQLEQYQAILAERKMKEYRKSVNCYDEVLNKILSGIPSEVFLYETIYTLRLDQDFQTTYEDKCCEHDCKTTTYTGFGAPLAQTVDDTVKAPCEVTLPLLSSLVKDLQQLGYYVRGLVTSCGFSCKKETRQSRYFSSQQVKNCCGEQMLLIIFKFGSDQGVISNQFRQNQPLFGQANSSGFSFGQPNMQKGHGLFGTAPFGSPQPSNGQVTGSLFGQSQSSSNTGCFGSSQPQGFGLTGQQSQASSFGGQQPQGFSFGGQQPQASSFGGQQPQGFSFGGQQQHTSGFGFGSQQTHASGFGSQQPQGFGLGYQKPEGASADTHSQNGSSFGSQQPKGSGFGNQQLQQSGFGSKQLQGSGFGSKQPQGFSFGSSKSEASNQSNDDPIGFGQSKVDNKASGFGLFGAAQQSQNVFGNAKPTIGSSSIFGKQVPNQPATRFGKTSTSSVSTDVPKQITTSTQSVAQSSGKPDCATASIKTPAFKFGSAFGSTNTSSGSCGTFSTLPTQAVGGGSLFKQSPSKTSGQVLFGGSAMFSSPIKMSSMEQSLFTLGSDVKSENVSSGNPVDVDQADDSTHDGNENEDDAS